MPRTKPNYWSALPDQLEYPPGVRRVIERGQAHYNKMTDAQTEWIRRMRAIYDFTQEDGTTQEPDWYRMWGDFLC